MYRQYDVDELSVASPSIRLVLLEMALHADRKGIVRMPQAELAAHTGLSPRMVAKAFAALADSACVSRLGHGRYQLLPDGDLPALSQAHAAGRVNGTALSAADAELARIQSLMEPHHAVVWTEHGWPVAVEYDQYGRERRVEL